MPRRAMDWSSTSMVRGVMMLVDVAHVAVTHRCVAWFGHPPLPYTARMDAPTDASPPPPVPLAVCVSR